MEIKIKETTKKIVDIRLVKDDNNIEILIDDNCVIRFWDKPEDNLWVNKVLLKELGFQIYN